jgi:hypothetical protein
MPTEANLHFCFKINQIYNFEKCEVCKEGPKLAGENHKNIRLTQDILALPCPDAMLGMNDFL